MITIHLVGGLGNQLFQIFTLINLSIKYNIPYFLPTTILSNANKLATKRNTYWDNILTNVNIDPNFYSITKKFNKIKENTYKKFNYKNNTILYGYYQDDKYFSENYNTIFKSLNFHYFQNNIKNKYENLLSNNTIALHFRLGDYKQKTDAHPILKIDYYTKSLKLFGGTYNILYFCEAEDNQFVNNLIKELAHPKRNFIKVPDNIPDWEQLLIMSCCNHNIIANSSFSWWGAYLNNNPHKLVCYPANWFGKENDRTYNIKNWHKI